MCKSLHLIYFNIVAVVCVLCRPIQVYGLVFSSIHQGATSTHCVCVAVNFSAMPVYVEYNMLRIVLTHGYPSSCRRVHLSKGSATSRTIINASKTSNTSNLMRRLGSGGRSGLGSRLRLGSLGQCQFSQWTFGQMNPQTGGPSDRWTLGQLIMNQRFSFLLNVFVHCE